MKVTLIKVVEDRMTKSDDKDGCKIIKDYLIADDITSTSDRDQIILPKTTLDFASVTFSLTGFFSIELMKTI